MRDFEGFCKDVERNIAEYLPNDLDVEDIRIQTVEKPNLGKRTALSVRLEGQVAAPLIYMDRFYDMYRSGMPEGEVMSRIADETVGALKEIPIIPDYMSQIDSWDAVKDHLIVDAMGVSQNRDRLPDIPHRISGDIACVCRIDAGGTGTILVSSSLAAKWDVPEDQIFETAISNSMKVRPAELSSMDDLLAELREDEPSGESWNPEDPDQFLGVITTKDRVKGACTIFYPDVQEKLAALSEKVGDLYIIPSSVHELLAVPARNGAREEELNQMIHEVNETCVDPVDRLSEFVHKFDARTKKLTCSTPIPALAEKAPSQEGRPYMLQGEMPKPRRTRLSI